jgi:hypothetical protein
MASGEAHQQKVGWSAKPKGPSEHLQKHHDTSIGTALTSTFKPNTTLLDEGPKAIQVNSRTHR